jgi:phosphoribosylglycinamide formyltransferase-1
MNSKIAIFASGRGSNADQIIQYFENNDSVNIGLIVSNKKKAGVLELASKHNINTLILDRNSFYNSEELLNDLAIKGITHIVLAGFLWMIPDYLILSFKEKIINIHPALLPKYGGKGMYGHHVHQAVLENKESESGITIHLVNEKYDEGKILFQASCELKPEMDAKEIAAKVLTLEHYYFPRIIELWVSEDVD